MNHVKKFYDSNPFPGPYTIKSIQDYNVAQNRYVNAIDSILTDGQQVLDVGCGTGLLTNIFALRYPGSSFTGIDFSTAATYAKQFSQENKIKNSHFVKKDFLDYQTTRKYDILIAQSFLTHVSDQIRAIEKLQELVNDGGKIILGVYDPVGKMMQKLFSPRYRNQRLQLDQESNPYDVCHSMRDIERLFPNFGVKRMVPGIANCLFFLYNVVYRSNGGLTLYLLQNEK